MCHEDIPAVLWVVLVFAWVAAVGFTDLFGLVLFTIGATEHPFSSGARIGTGAFELVLERFETSKLSNLR
jgi:hypothetical protein